MMDANIRVIVNDIRKIIRKRGLETGGRVQRFIDSEVIRRMDPYTPFDTGFLKGSSLKIDTKIGSGTIVQKARYARRQYHTNKGNGLRGRYWFERMKADHRENILRGALEIAKNGGKK